MNRNRHLLVGALVLVGIGGTVWAISAASNLNEPHRGSGPEPAELDAQDPLRTTTTTPHDDSDALGDEGTVPRNIGQTPPGAGSGRPSPPAVSRYMREVGRYGLGVWPASRSPLAWELEFRSPRQVPSPRGATIVADQNATRLHRQGTAVARIDVTGAPVTAPPSAHVYATTGQGSRTSVAEVSVHVVATQGGTRIQVVIDLSQLETSVQEAELAVPIRVGDQEELVDFFFELFDADGLAVLGPVSDEVRDGHIVFNVAVRAAHRSRVRAVARISSVEGEPVAMVRSEANVSAGAGSLQLWLAGSFVEDHMPTGRYVLHDIELSQFGMGSREHPAIRWTGRYPFDVPAQVAWASTPPIPASQNPVADGDIVRLP